MIAYRLALIASALVLGLGAPYVEASEKPGAARSVLLFDKLCYEMVPELSRIESIAAENKWQAVEGAALQRFAPPVSQATPRVANFTHITQQGRPHPNRSRDDLPSMRVPVLPPFKNAQLQRCLLNR